MGISGLLPLLKEASRQGHVRDHAGKRFAVDGYVLLHRGISTCAQELALGQHRAATPRYVNYAMERVRMLRHFGLEPYFVFDGGPLPSKRGTEDERAKKRSEALAQATSCIAEGNASLAREWYLKAVDVTPQMAYQLIKALREANVAYLVAPYEADAQLAYLEREGIVDGVITEDSDLLVFGCRTVLYKLDRSGSCTEVKRERFTACRDFNLHGWTDAEFRHMAILSGCDYVDSINGLGLKMAYKLIKRYKSWLKAVQSVRLDGKLKVPATYERDFRRAEMTFLHQVVFDPRTNRAVHFTPLPAAGLSDELLLAVGETIEPTVARGIATGSLCPCSRKTMVDICPNEIAETPKAGPSKLKKGKQPDLRADQSRIDLYFSRGSSSAKGKGKASAPVKRAAKRPALDELNRNAKRSATEPSLDGGRGLKSRFFGSGAGSKSAPSIPSGVAIDVDESTDEDLDAILREVPPPPPPPPRSDAFEDEDALDALRDMETLQATDAVPTSEPPSPVRRIKAEPVFFKLEPGVAAPSHERSDISSPMSTPHRRAEPTSRSPQSSGKRAAKALSEISISSPVVASPASPVPSRAHRPATQVSAFTTSPVSDPPSPDEDVRPPSANGWHQRFAFSGSAVVARSSATSVASSSSSHRPIAAVALKRPPLSPTRAPAKRRSDTAPFLAGLDSFRYRP